MKPYTNTSAPRGKSKMLPQQESATITAELIVQLRDGNQKAFKKVYLHYRDPLENFLFSLLRCREEAEEMTQDVFMTLWEKRAVIDPSKNIRSFIYTIARNSVMNFFNHRKVLEKYVRTADLPTHDDTTSEDILVAREVELLIRLAVDRMPKVRQTVFRLSHYENLDHSQIADRLGVSKANVANHLALARKEIKNVLTLFIPILMSLANNLRS